MVDKKDQQEWLTDQIGEVIFQTGKITHPIKGEEWLFSTMDFPKVGMEVMMTFCEEFSEQEVREIASMIGQVIVDYLFDGGNGGNC